MYFNLKGYIDISKLLNKNYDFYAHLEDSKKASAKAEEIKKETLKEHTDLCKEYFEKLIRQKNIDEVFLNFEKYYFKELSEDGKNLFRSLIINTIAMHDMGKINPYFQIRKMDNPQIKSAKAFDMVGSDHSILSAVLYIDYFFDKVLKLEKSDKNSILPFLFLNGYIISKHHGDLDDFYRFLNKFNDGEIGFKVIELFSNTYKEIYIKGFKLGNNQAIKVCNYIKGYLTKKNKVETIYLYTYERLLYSLLVACDFYATTEFMGDVRLNEFGELGEIDEFYDVYKNTEVYKGIRQYECEEYCKDNKDLLNERNINILRNEMFLDAEKELIKNKEDDIFFLEAPTGSGKSNVSMNLSFKLFEENEKLKKIFYVYPFNTLVEQNLITLSEIFDKHKEILKRIAVINSVTPIKLDRQEKEKGSKEEDDYKYYAKALLDRQFLNYPFILTTHVSLFNTMFNVSKEAAFAFHQLANSVIVLDEIQSYKNIIWAEIIAFLKGFAKLFNMKIIIMSATLPNLNILTDSEENTAQLIKNRQKYFINPLFKDRVKVSYELMEEEDTASALFSHVINKIAKDKKILIEFIKKESAYRFYRDIKGYIEENTQIGYQVELMTGDDNSIERQRILKNIKSEAIEKECVILVATQVIEAGVDIDMDIGYKDISKLDSDEQFMGRINRSCKRKGIVYFFNLDKTDGIYKNDVRVNKALSLLDDSMREILIKKNFEDYYFPVLKLIRKKYNEVFNDNNLENFFKEAVGKLDFKVIEKRMELIDENKWSMSVYLARTINKEEGDKLIIIDGKKVWEEYEKLLNNNSMDYSKKQVELSEIKSKMNYFIYQINKNDDLLYNSKIGELYYIENGDKYFEGEKLDKDKFKKEIGLFVGF
ncbi:CRISPR-associated helicase/endonuclease Cas3 [Clostridium sp. BL-8]|uniref:CRISPR-associated helicase/endonuclease Cas3 n=1 Tax=Clostridium sp. BL-8 TaxID=349938 RepID=UPI00098C7013|nr:CRISPR-associated helicase/endonuclease Cas3 [Clostridium sp. BL-8]OOM81329.1 helicase Cas3 [Clostridium sp. BL-8]